MLSCQQELKFEKSNVICLEKKITKQQKSIDELKTSLSDQEERIDDFMRNFFHFMRNFLRSFSPMEISSDNELYSESD